MAANVGEAATVRKRNANGRWIRQRLCWASALWHAMQYRCTSRCLSEERSESADCGLQRAHIQPHVAIYITFFNAQEMGRCWGHWR